MPMRVEQLKTQIEDVRNELGKRLKNTSCFEECYELNLKLDALIEEYLELTQSW